MDFYDFRNMFLSMQFIPEYSCPLYLEEKFNDGRVGLVKKEEPEKKSIYKTYNSYLLQNKYSI